MKWFFPKIIFPRLNRAAWTGGVVAALAIVLSVYLFFLYGIVTDRFEGKRWQLPSKIYSDSFILYSGQDVKGIQLEARLKRLGYREVQTLPQNPGEYRLKKDFLDLFQNDFLYPDHAFRGFPMRFLLKDGKFSEIMEWPSRSPIVLAELEPELITAIYAGTWEERDLIRWQEVPPYLIEAIVSTEDVRYFNHFGMDPRSIARAIWVNLKNLSVVQGGSTLTQQLVKNFYLNQDRTLSRKFNEMFMALILEARYSKGEILEAYLNEIYMGQSGMMGIYGMGQAARFYFGKKADALTLGEAALLAGMIRSPNLYSPFVDPVRAHARRRQVLDRMLNLDKIDLLEYRKALDDPIPRHPPLERKRQAPYFVDYVREQLGEHYSSDVLNSEGLKIFTTLDVQQQLHAEEAMVGGLENLEGRYPHLRRENPGDRLQGALVALQPQTGHIKAMVGGRNYGVSQFNRVTQAKRQPGSLFKPFVFAAALTDKDPLSGKPYTAATLIEDTPITLTSPDGDWIPQNYDKTFRGFVTMRSALESSLNVATVRLAQNIGTDRVIALAQAMGIKSPLRNIPSLVLGASEVVPIEMAMAYSTIANGGVRVEPMAIKQVVDGAGRILERRTLEMTPILAPQEAFLLTYLLQGVVDHGTGNDIRAMGFTRPVAGKTGTTSHYKDAWFIGYTPELLGLVWVGFDSASTRSENKFQSGRENSPASSVVGEMRLTGSQAALPLWTRFMTDATSGFPEGEFSIPPGIVFEKIDPKTGLLSMRKCPESVREAFMAGTEPQESCDGSKWSPRKFFRWFKDFI